MSLRAFFFLKKNKNILSQQSDFLSCPPKNEEWFEVFWLSLFCSAFSLKSALYDVIVTTETNQINEPTEEEQSKEDDDDDDHDESKNHMFRLFLAPRVANQKSRGAKKPRLNQQQTTLDLSANCLAACGPSWQTGLKVTKGGRWW